MRHRRERYQRGSLTIEKRSNSSDVWVYRWREVSNHGSKTQRKQIIGTKKDYPTETAAWKAVEGLQLNINAEAISSAPMTIGQLVEHYNLIELAATSNKTPRTREVYRQHIDSHILPRWADEKIGNVKAFTVEAWLKSLPYAPATKAKSRNILSALYQHAMRYGWADRNPIREVRQSSKRVQEPDVLTPAEVSALLAELPEPSRTSVLIAATTGLRRGELFGLKWGDVDLDNAKVRIVRSIVDQVAGEPKTAGSKRDLPLPLVVVEALEAWRLVTRYRGDNDWVFASDYHLGNKPFWPNTVLVRHVKPAAERAGITKQIGWHSFRRTLATLLDSSGASVKTTQELMRHASPVMTLGTYAQAVTADKRQAQDRISALFA
jgi:integrase